MKTTPILRESFRYTLLPLIQDGRNCLVCHDVEGMEWTALESVEFYYGGSPWQQITRHSEDIFALVERGILKWPALERIVAAHFRFRVKNDPHSRRMIVRPPALINDGNALSLIAEEWLLKRRFLEVQPGEGKPVE